MVKHENKKLNPHPHESSGSWGWHVDLLVFAVTAGFVYWCLDLLSK